MLFASFTGLKRQLGFYFRFFFEHFANILELGPGHLTDLFHDSLPVVQRAKVPVKRVRRHVNLVKEVLAELFTCSLLEVPLLVGGAAQPAPLVAALVA